MATAWGQQQQTIDLVSRYSAELLGLRVEDGYLFAHGGSIELSSRWIAKTHCSPAATLQYIFICRDRKARPGEAVMRDMEALRGAAANILRSAGPRAEKENPQFRVQNPLNFGVTSP